MSSILVKNDEVKFTTSTSTTTQKTGFPTVGTILCWAGNNTDNLDDDYLVCEGGEFSPILYPELYNVIGYRYGQGTGTKFKVPDFKNKMPAGSQSTSTMKLDDLDGYSGGSFKMEKNHFPHSHDVETVNINYGVAFNVATWGGGTKRSTGQSTAKFSRDSTNPIKTVNTDKNYIEEYNTQTGTLPPYTLFTFIIKAK